MPTIAMTKRYSELTYRHLKLLQLYSVMSELRLHTNKSVDKKTAHYYNQILFAWDDYAPFMAASLQSMMQVFYIELDGFIGAFWDKKKNKVQLRGYEYGSLSAYLYDGTRTTRKKSSIRRFESLLIEHSDQLQMVNDARGVLAHFTKLNTRNSSYIPGDLQMREILNAIAEVLYLLGYRRGNKPHYIERDSRAVVSTQKVIDRLVSVNPKAKDMRQKYTDAREEWYIQTKA